MFSSFAQWLWWRGIIGLLIKPQLFLLSLHSVAAWNVGHLGIKASAAALLQSLHVCCWTHYESLWTRPNNSSVNVTFLPFTQGFIASSEACLSSSVSRVDSYLTCPVKTTTYLYVGLWQHETFQTAVRKQVTAEASWVGANHSSIYGIG